MGTTMKKVAAKPVSVSPLKAAQMLDIHYDTFRKKFMNPGVFTVLRPKGRGVGRRCYIPTDEVELYGITRDEMAVQNLRSEKGRLPKASR